MSGAREQAKGQASDPVLTPRFLVILAHSVRVVQLLGGSEGGGCVHIFFSVFLAWDRKKILKPAQPRTQI